MDDSSVLWDEHMASCPDNRMGAGMKRNVLSIVFASTVMFAGDTLAANWFALQNNELPGAKPNTFWGFIQPQYVHNQGGAVNGMAAPAQVQGYNGQPAVFNLV